MSPRLSDGAGDSLISHHRRDRDGSNARLGGPRSLLPLGSSSPGTVGAGMGPGGAQWCCCSPSPLALVREGSSGWEWPGDAPNCRRISQLQGNIPPEPASPGQGCPDLLGTRCLLRKTSQTIHQKPSRAALPKSRSQISLAFTEAAATAFCSPSKTQASSKAPAANRSCLG